jgi:hypothetical protein
MQVAQSLVRQAFGPEIFDYLQELRQHSILIVEIPISGKSFSSRSYFLLCSFMKARHGHGQQFRNQAADSVNPT